MSTNTVLFPRTRITTNDHKLLRKMLAEKIQLTFILQDTHKYLCQFAKRSTPRLKMFVFSENRTNSPSLSAKSKDQNLVCHQMLYTDFLPTTHSNRKAINRGVAASLCPLAGFNESLSSFLLRIPNSLVSTICFTHSMQHRITRLKRSNRKRMSSRNTCSPHTGLL